MSGHLSRPSSHWYLFDVERSCSSPMEAKRMLLGEISGPNMSQLFPTVVQALQKSLFMANTVLLFTISLSRFCFNPFWTRNSASSCSMLPQKSWFCMALCPNSWSNCKTSENHFLVGGLIINGIGYIKKDASSHQSANALSVAWKKRVLTSSTFHLSLVHHRLKSFGLIPVLPWPKWKVLPKTWPSHRTMPNLSATSSSNSTTRFTKDQGPAVPMSQRVKFPEFSVTFEGSSKLSGFQLGEKRGSQNLNCGFSQVLSMSALKPTFQTKAWWQKRVPSRSRDTIVARRCDISKAISCAGRYLKQWFVVWILLIDIVIGYS